MAICLVAIFDPFLGAQSHQVRSNTLSSLFLSTLDTMQNPPLSSYLHSIVHCAWFHSLWKKNGPI